MKCEGWLFLFVAISGVCALAAFCKIDILTITKMFGEGTYNTAPFSLRDIFVFVSILVSLALSGTGFYLTKGENILRLTNGQKRTLVSEAERMKTLISSVIVAATNGNPATLPLAQDIADVFSRAGIEPLFAFARPDTSAQSGIVLCMDDFGRPPPATEDLKQALTKAGIDFTVGGFPMSGFAGSGRTEDFQHGLALWVAPNPL